MKEIQMVIFKENDIEYPEIKPGLTLNDINVYNDVFHEKCSRNVFLSFRRPDRMKMHRCLRRYTFEMNKSSFQKGTSSFRRRV